MNLVPYLDTVRSGATNAAALADEHTQQVAMSLGTALDTATRLALIHVLSDAAAQLSAELAPSSVELRMVGQDPELVVVVSPAGHTPTVLRPEVEEGEDADPDEEPVARISLRLPGSVKTKVDELASREGISTNTWLTRAVLDALGDRRPGHGPVPPPPPQSPGVGGFFGPAGPFGPGGVFGAGGPFGAGRDRQQTGDPGRRGSTGAVQGWVR